MHRALRGAWPVALLVAVTAAWAGGRQPPGEPPKQPPQSAAEQYKALVKESDDAMAAFMKEYNAAKTPEEKQKLVQEKYPQPQKYADRFLKIAEDNPKDPAAADALVWVCTHLGSGPAVTKAADLLMKDHLQSDKLGAACAALGRGPNGEQNLRAILEKNPHHDVQGLACFALAQSLKSRADRGGNEAMSKEALALFERVAKEFADVKNGTRALGPMAEGELFETRYLSVGKVAPDIEDEDLDGVKFKLSDYRGKVVMLDFWGNW
jgi:Rieske Fe-S protein